jgi:hypothetical protein
VIAHTQLDRVKNVKFALEKDTISIYSNRLNPDLAIMHGCQSGAGIKLGREGLMSLPRMFLYNGSKSTISSFWDADNESSVEMFKVFYDQLSKGEAVSKALYNAQISIKNSTTYSEWASPYYWANWRVMGKDLAFEH